MSTGSQSWRSVWRLEGGDAWRDYLVLALDALDEERAGLEAAIAKASSVAELNAIAWPEWVAWSPIPENPEFVLEAEPPRGGNTLA